MAAAMAVTAARHTDFNNDFALNWRQQDNKQTTDGKTLAYEAKQLTISLKNKTKQACSKTASGLGVNDQYQNIWIIGVQKYFKPGVEQTVNIQWALVLRKNNVSYKNCFADL